MVDGPKGLRHFALVHALVEFRVIERYRERGQRLTAGRGQRGNHARVESAAQVRAHTRIRPQTQPNGILQQGPQYLGTLAFRPLRRRVGERRLPMRRDGDAPGGPRQRVSGRQLADALEYGPGRQRRPERENVVQTGGLQFSADVRVRE